MRSASEGRSLLVIGHPGHELRVYGWVGQVRPIVCILTDGSGSDGTPRLDKTLEILHELGAEIGPLCGELSDRRIYEKILRHEYDLFDILCERLARLIIAQDIDLVVSDAIEGYNPVHDLCEALVRTAIDIARNANDADKTRTRKPCTVRHYTIPLMNDPRPATGSMEAAHHTVELTPLRFKQKLEAMRSYAISARGILQEEVADAFHNFGEQAFAREYLFAAAAPGQEPERRFSQQKPFYETYGEQKVAAGRYQSVIRFGEHVLPIVKHLRKKVSDTWAEAQG
ncbi:hypothetical protein [Nitrosospira sp. Nsp1]|uniref:hypothetical protein n=1 Tax=Nitrosospira sp. Nsp1 TaxID=136547 RepID=UPI00087F89AF|nr:hypothetical protein [Nitrosospira sp. Nsp1]SCX63027.1 hypothetical protein SAMN05720354_13416 [Nitrosospira sp. Nsp1]